MSFETTASSSATDKWFISDAQFNSLYPEPIQALSKTHWTPLNAAKEAARFLAAEKSARILDIGSGVGKFCLAAAHYQPDAFYYGVEQRKYLVDHAEAARLTLGYENVSFIHANFTALDLKAYHHFYFYNSFYENLAPINRIDETVEYSNELYHRYTRRLLLQLEAMPGGTRLATLCCSEEDMPADFHVVGSSLDDYLKFSIKI
ncbi:MAG TPA: class I SAM-dependent methyltransferase [Flavitalea sp.]|nr:class I SAM-dependent methyltransferase [Flavitalea sp.]